MRLKHHRHQASVFAQYFKEMYMVDANPGRRYYSKHIAAITKKHEIEAEMYDVY